MRIARFAAGGQERCGIVVEAQLRELEGMTLADALELSIENAAGLQARAGRFWELTDVAFLAPVERASRIFAIAQNYPAHAAEMGGDRSPSPIIFLKPASSAAPPQEELRIPPVSAFFDYEGELGVVIGRRGSNIPSTEALDHVAGYTVCNDGSARDLLPAVLGGKPVIDWFSGKAIDRSSPIGPWVVTTDEVGDPQQLALRTRLNGEVVQEDRTSSMVFSIAEQIAYISARVGLEPGDVLMSGTPGGVGRARGRNLQPGDVVEVEVDRVGVLRTTYVLSES